MHYWCVSGLPVTALTCVSSLVLYLNVIMSSMSYKLCVPLQADNLDNNALDPLSCVTGGSASWPKYSIRKLLWLQPVRLLLCFFLVRNTRWAKSELDTAYYVVVMSEQSSNTADTSTNQRSVRKRTRAATAASAALAAITSASSAAAAAAAAASTSQTVSAVC